MLVDVPAPPWIISTAKASSCAPAITLAQTDSMMRALSAGNTPKVQLARAAASFTAPKARITSGKSDNFMPDIGKFSIARWVWMPQSRSAGNSIVPKLSVSKRVFAVICWPFCCAGNR
jgi:hypothetical protein